MAAWYWYGRTRITEPCDFSVGVDCGIDPYCPYPYQQLRYGQYCCCENSSGYQYKVTLITADCGPGYPMQACEDFPFCASENEFVRMGDSCCCQRAATVGPVFRPFTGIPVV